MIHPVTRPLLLAPLLLLHVARSAAADVVQLVAAKDNTVYESQPTESNGAGVGLFAGKNTLGRARRALLRFDLSAIPAGSTIQSAELRLVLTMASSPPSDFTAHRVLASWGEGASNPTDPGGSGTQALDCDATWLFRFFAGATCAATPWSQLGGDYDPNPSAVAMVGHSGAVMWGGPGLVADVQAFVDGTLANEGWLVRHVDELTATTAKRFGSRESTVAGDRPLLTVTYDLPGTSAFCSPGAPNTVSSGGSFIELQGSRSLSANDNTLIARDLPNAIGRFAQATATVPAFTPHYGGNVCIGGMIGRFPPQFVQNGVAMRFLDFAGTGIETFAQAGQTWHYQFVHRDTTPVGGNVSAGLTITWLP